MGFYRGFWQGFREAFWRAYDEKSGRAERRRQEEAARQASIEAIAAMMRAEATVRNLKRQAEILETTRRLGEEKARAQAAFGDLKVGKRVH